MSEGKKLFSESFTAALLAWQEEGDRLREEENRQKEEARLATRRPARERARRALNVLFPSAIPDAPALSNKRLAKKVNTWLATEGLDPVDESTIRRAAGRK